MTENRSSLRILIPYYGLLQSAHGVALLRAGWLLLRGGEMPFPAPPPPGGWSPQAVFFLLALGILDGFNILLALRFTAQFLRTGEHNNRLGLISLTIACASAMVFAIATGLSGAWFAHPWAYSLMGVLFLPVAWLFALLARSHPPLTDRLI